MSNFSGVIEAVSVPKPGKNPWGQEYVKYSFNIDGNWFGYFANDKADPVVTAVVESLSKGMVVSGTSKETDRGFVNIVSVVVEGAGAEHRMEATQKEQIKSYTAKSNDRDYRITYLASRKDAIAIVGILVEVGQIDLGKKADAFDNLSGLVEELTNSLAEKAMSVGAPSDE